MGCMKFAQIQYSKLNSRQKEIFNFQKVAGVLADYGFNCIKLADDWQGADFLAYHKDGNETLKVQLKGRLTINKKYQGKDLFMAFPLSGSWCLIEHDQLLSIVLENTKFLDTKSWSKGEYSTGNPSQQLRQALSGNVLPAT